MLKLVWAVGGTVLLISLGVLASPFEYRLHHPTLAQGALIALAILPPLMGAAIEFAKKRARDPATRIWGAFGVFVGYVIAALIFAICAFYLAYTFVLSPYFPWSASWCKRGDAVCLSHVDPTGKAPDIAYDVVFAGIWLLCVGGIAFTTWRRTRPDKVLTPAQKQDRDWFLDKETGEYQRIYAIQGNSVLFRRSSYKERTTERAWAIQQRKEKINTFIGLSLVTAVFLALAYIFSGHWLGLLFGFVLIVALINLLYQAGETLEATTSSLPEVGPPPVQPPDIKKEVERQKVYGDGGIATREETLAAARGAAVGRAAHPADEQEFDD